MYNVKLDKLEFQSEHDVIDYITKGIVPKRSDAYEVFVELRNPGQSLINLNYDLDERESKKFAAVMEQVYENVSEFQKLAAIGCGLSGLLGFFLGRRI